LNTPPDIGEITRLLSEYQEQIKSAEKYIPADAASFDLLFSLSRSASETGVTISKLKAEPITRDKMTLEYWTTRYSVEVTGPSVALVGFIEKVERLPQSTLLLDKIVLKPSANQWVLSFQVSLLSREEPKTAGSGPPAPPIRTDPNSLTTRP
jgi:Tfp pilus assembly protein PilO